MRLGLVLPDARTCSFTCLSTGGCPWQGSGPGRVLGAGVGSASSQLGVPKQVTSLLWLQFSKLKNGVTYVCLG